MNFIVTYIDALGGVQRIHDRSALVFHEEFNLIWDATQKQFGLKRDSRFDISYHTFSDNICIVCGIKDENDFDSVFLDLLSFLSIFQTISNGIGIFIRGAISYGEIISGPHFILGEALVEAVHYEENIAVYPRIITTESMMKKLGGEKLQTLIEAGLISRRDDFIPFVDYLGWFCIKCSSPSEMNEEDKELLRNNAVQCILELNSINDYKTKQKLFWLATYISNIAARVKMDDCILRYCPDCDEFICAKELLTQTKNKLSFIRV